MFKTKKPWLNYGLGDGRDKVETPPKKHLKKYGSAVWLFFTLGGIGGHRIYAGDYWRAFRCYIFIILTFEFIALPFKLTEKFPFSFSIYVYGLVFYGALVMIVLWEFRTIKPSIERINKETENENE